MKTFHLLIVIASLATLSLGTYAVFGNFHANDSSSLGEASSQSSQANGHGGGMTHDITALRQELTFISTEMDTLKGANVKIGALHTELNKLKAELAALRGRLEDIGRIDDRYHGSINQEVSLDSPPLTEEDMNAQVEQQQEKDRRHMEQIDKAFQAEPIDQKWSFDTIHLITQALEGVDAKQTDLSHLECHSTMCFVKANHRDAAAADAFALKFPMQVAQALPGITYYSQPRDDGSVDVRMYLARNGYALPQTTQ
jgi:hypothetical protein